MTTNQIIHTQLDCRATAHLHDSIANDLSMPDKPIASLLQETENKDTNESKDTPNNSD
jgi:hypothetical protein